MHTIEESTTTKEKSRLEENLKKQTKKNILITIGGILGLIAISFVLGPYILIGMGMLFGKSTSLETTPTQEEITYLAPPVLQKTFDATASASISLRGMGNEKSKIVLYQNNNKIQTTLSDNTGNFVFTNILLKEGTNNFYSKTITEQAESASSNQVRVLLLTNNPTLEITSPSDGDKFSSAQSPIKITGKTDPEVKVTINDFWAIVDNMGNYTYSYALKDGENTLVIKATDKAGNISKKELNIIKE